MSADVLRRAAELMRYDWAGADAMVDDYALEGKTFLAVADWLNAEIAAVDNPVNDLCRDFHGNRFREVSPEALAVARAYLGEPA